MTPVEQGGDPKKFDRELVSYALCKRHRLVIAPLQRLLVLAFPVSDAVVLFLQKKMQKKPFGRVLEKINKDFGSCPKKKYT